MKFFLCIALIAIVGCAFAQDEAKKDTTPVAVEATKEGTKTDEKKEGVEERGFLGQYGGGLGGFGGQSGFNQFGTHGNAGGFNQGSNQFAANQQHSNAAGFKNVHGYREQQGYNHNANNQYGSGFNANAGGFNKQHGAYGNQHGSFGGGFGRR